MNSDTKATVIFLKKLEKYQTEKPYCIHVPASAVPGGKFTNEEDEKLEIILRDMRPLKASLNINKNGFEVLDCPPFIDYADFADKDLVEKAFIPRIEAVVKQKLAASYVWCFEWKV